jgi:hypothetical protein
MEVNSISRILKITLLLVVTISFSGCSLFRTGIASLKSTSEFHPLEADKRVLAEPGAEELAKQVAAYLPEAVRTIEKEQYRDFVKPIEIYVCTTEESFVSHTGLSKQVRGAIITKLWLSGKLRNPEVNNTTKAILTHELSHLHLQQQLGVYDYNAKIPAWFQEGLAVLVSRGGGAEDISEAVAAKEILDGERFTPEAQGSFFFHKSGRSYGLGPHLFYRQASMFVGYLRNLSEIQFALFMLAIEDGGDFDESFRSKYGMSIDEAWQDFVTYLRNKQSERPLAVILSIVS